MFVNLRCTDETALPLDDEEPTPHTPKRVPLDALLYAIAFAIVIWSLIA